MLGVTSPVHGKSTVYMAINRVNGKRYVGITKRYLSKRRGDHHANANRGSNIYFHKAIRKYGIDAFRFDALALVDDYEAAKQMEIWLIEQMKPEYNCTKGGDGYLGYVPTPEAIEKIRAANIGRTAYWKGKKIPEHVVQAMRDGRRNMSPESRQKLLESLKRTHAKNSKPIICINDGRRFACAREAAKVYGVSKNAVNGVCQKNGKNFTAKGLVFRFEDDPDLSVAPALVLAASCKARAAKSCRAVALQGAVNG